MTTDDQPRTEVDLTTARELLEAERDDLVATLRDQIADSAPQDTDATTGIGETDHLVNSEHNELAARVAAVTRATLDEVEAALARLDDGSYGTCTACGQSIAPERLAAIPAAAQCVNCQSTRGATSAFA